MKCQLMRALKYGPSAGVELDGTVAEVGTMIQDPFPAWELVVAGDAVACDEECAQAAWKEWFPKEAISGRLTKVQLDKLKQKTADVIYAKNPVAAGVWPEDYDDFYAGRMTGYDPETGDHIPGPNAEETEYDGSIYLGQ